MRIIPDGVEPETYDCEDGGCYSYGYEEWQTIKITDDEWYEIIKGYAEGHIRIMLNRITGKYEKCYNYPFAEYLRELIKLNKDKK